ncbi:hypothetical protein BGZ63DRAFT_424694 [Mariannaea sp. PMI_226]|nr:hypothetical protein BGZ63DRAFT_424694 [Mariannaea sp. PMI_226]
MLYSYTYLILLNLAYQSLAAPRVQSRQSEPADSVVSIFSTNDLSGLPLKTISANVAKSDDPSTPACVSLKPYAAPNFIHGVKVANLQFGTCITVYSDEFCTDSPIALGDEGVTLGQAGEIANQLLSFSVDSCETDPPEQPPKNPPPVSPKQQLPPKLDPSPTDGASCFAVSNDHMNDLDRVVSILNSEDELRQRCNGTDSQWSFQGHGGSGPDPQRNNNICGGLLKAADNAPPDCQSLFSNGASDDIQALCSAPMIKLAQDCPFNGGTVNNICGTWFLRARPYGSACVPT